jgi:hypothetical protein
MGFRPISKFLPFTDRIRPWETESVLLVAKKVGATLCGARLTRERIDRLNRSCT